MLKPFLKTFAELNLVLKFKFQKLHKTVVNSINTASIVDYLFQEGVIGDEDMHTLQVPGDSRQQCRSLLSLLHLSDNPQAFVQLYRAIKEEPHLQWLIDNIDQLPGPLPDPQLQPTCASESAGNSYAMMYLLGENCLLTLLPSKELRERLGVDDIALVLQQNRLRGYGHVLRKDDDD